MIERTEQLISQFLQSPSTMTEQQRHDLSSWIVQDVRNTKEFIEAALFHRSIHDVLLDSDIERKHILRGDINLPDINAGSFDCQLWEKLLKEEKNAPEVKIKHAEEPEILIQKVQRQKVVHKISKSSLFSLVAAAAAIVLVFVLTHFSPPETSIKVAVLLDSINAKWSDTDNAMKKGDPFWTSRESILLHEGIAQLIFDNQVQVTIEGPAEFKILDEDKINLRYGKIYAMVPSQAIGFMIATQTAKVIDLGTEFGIQSNVNGSMELHVMKGKTQLFAGSEGNAKSSQIITENEAIRYNVNAGKAEIIPIAANAFVRSIDSKTKTIWRGQTHINLANIVAGGDGFQDVKALVGLDPLSGKYTTSIAGRNRTSNNTYNLVLESDYIDGVFVPDGRSGAIQITSSGITFACPETSGIFTNEIAVYKGSLENQKTSVPQCIINGKKLENESLVFLHSNVGITFDLQKIHESLPQLDMKGFKTKAGFTENVNIADGIVPDVDFWILVDGQIKYQKQGLRLEDGVISINVDFSAKDQYLTLIVTDGIASVSSKRKFPAGLDSFFLIDPELVLIEKP